MKWKRALKFFFFFKIPELLLNSDTLGDVHHMYYLHYLRKKCLYFQRILVAVLFAAQFPAGG